MIDQIVCTEADAPEMRELTEEEVTAVAGGSGYVIGQGRSSD